MNVIISNKYKDALSSLNIDVIKKLDGELDVNTIIETFSNFYFNRMILDITSIKNYLDLSQMQKLSTHLDASKIILLLDNDPRINNTYLSKLISLGIYNFTSELSGVSYLMSNPNSYRDVAQYHDLAMEDERKIQEARGQKNFYEDDGYAPVAFNRNKIIGFKDITPDAGATTLIYMLKKQMRNLKVLAVEINDNDFTYFDDNEMMSISVDGIANLRSKLSQFDVVLIDLNNSSLIADGTCTDIIYLLEPSTIKLNTLMRRDQNALERIKHEKIVLNKSLLSVSDVKEFEYEAKINTFYNIPPLDERKDHQMALDGFLNKLNIPTSGRPNNIADIFMN